MLRTCSTYDTAGEHALRITYHITPRKQHECRGRCSETYGGEQIYAGEQIIRTCDTYDIAGTCITYHTATAVHNSYGVILTYLSFEGIGASRANISAAEKFISSAADHTVILD